MDDSRPRQPSSEPCLGQFSSGLPDLDTFPQPNLPGTASAIGLQASGTNISLVFQKRTPILEVVLEIGTMIVGMVKTAPRTTVKRVGDDGPADPTSEDSGEAAGITPASLIKPQGNRRNLSTEPKDWTGNKLLYGLGMRLACV